MAGDLRASLCLGDLDWRMPSSSQNVSVDLVELSSDDEDSSQPRKPFYQIPCVAKLPVKTENLGSLSTCKLEPTDCIINCQSPPIVASDLGDILHEDRTQNSEYISQQLPLVASQEVRMNLTRMTNGFNASVPGLCLTQSGPSVAHADSWVAQNGGEQIENPSRISSSSHDSFGLHAQPNFCNFWKAGDYNAICNQELSSAKGTMERVRVHPKFLHSNATSHKWAFGAIAELLDNAVDEIRNGATFIKVDIIHNKRDNSPALLFHDNGGGMDPECMRQCMSLGYSSKKSSGTIGQYGNGFKTSTMRLGADTIVFSRTSYKGILTESIGLLSYTFLRKTGQDDVIVPLVDFEISNGHTEPMIHSSLDDWKENMNILLQWSPFSTEEELMQQFEDVGVQGTKIIIFNLWLNDDGILELDFDDDKEDIRLRNPSICEAPSGLSTEKVESHISSRIRHSLREYASILYLRKFENFQIILRGRPVKQHNITDDLMFSEVIMYKPQLGFRAKEVSVAITVGFVKEARKVGAHGFNLYHRNRLIMPFWKVIQFNSSCGRGVVGYLEADFVEPAHDKQDFERSAVFLRLESKLKQVVSDYWNQLRCLFHLGFRLNYCQGGVGVIWLGIRPLYTMHQ
ncbi:protein MICRORCHIDIA 2-like isoform X3 [Nymphaea colorata]|uniref:protein MICRORCHIDIA 2-like isoform X3 n=1 Tax=Nymphaea colorata TaxID=210225 RepID=UPI00129D7CEB|nr:protein MICRORCHIDIA 2-like isoform X3 [Nymphaea colorata]